MKKRYQSCQFSYSSLGNDMNPIKKEYFVIVNDLIIFHLLIFIRFYLFYQIINSKINNLI